MFFMRFPIDAVFVGKAGVGRLATRCCRCTGASARGSGWCRSSAAPTASWSCPSAPSTPARPSRATPSGSAEVRRRPWPSPRSSLGALSPRSGSAAVWPSPLVIVLAAIGASLVAIIAATEWRHFNDEYAYWLAGARLVGRRAAVRPRGGPEHAVRLLVSAAAGAGAGAVDLVRGRRRVQRGLDGPAARLPVVARAGATCSIALALVAFLPVAVELRVRNVHLLLAVLVVLALRRSWAFWVPAAALKITPVLGVVYLAAAGRWRDAVEGRPCWASSCSASASRLPRRRGGSSSTSWALRAGTDGGSLLPIPFAIRFAAGAILAVVAGLVAAGRIGPGGFRASRARRCSSSA